MTDLASLMADEPASPHWPSDQWIAASARNEFRAKARPLLEAREQALLARVVELEEYLHRIAKKRTARRWHGLRLLTQRGLMMPRGRRIRLWSTSWLL